MIRNITIPFLALACVAATSCGSGGGTDQPYRPETLITKVDCEEMIAQLKAPQEVALAKVPADYEVLINADGMARLIFITKVCTWDNPEPLDDAETQEVHIYIEIKGEAKTVSLPGAEVSWPSAYAYNIFFDVKGPVWMKELVEHYGFKVNLEPEVEIDPYGDVRTGHVVEENGSGYRWTELTEPFGTTILLGQTDYFYYNNENGLKAKAEKSALSEFDSVGWLTLRIDPDSKLADFGSMLQGETMDIRRMEATYTIWSE